MSLSQINGVLNRFRVPILATVVVLAVGVLGLAVWSLTKDYGDKGNEFILFTVANSDLPIVVTERGNLEAQLETPIRCEVESLTRDSTGNFGTQIIFIVPNGSAVKEGDLLVELDSAALREKLDSQILSHQKAVSSRTQATAKFNNQILQNQTLEAEATLKVELSELEHEMYLDPDKGTYRLAVDDIERTISDQSNVMLEKRARAKLTEIQKTAVEKLFNLGYRTRNDVIQVNLEMMMADDALASSTNNLKSAEAKLGKLQSYERKMQEKTLSGEVETTKRQLQQVRNNNESQLAQAEAAKIEAESWEEKEKERLENYTEQLTKCKIYAPHGGMVVYAREGRDGGTEIAEGISVRERQRIMSLPDLSRMQVKTQIHEAVLDQVRPGLPVTVRVDAFPDQLYYGFVHEVAVVPSSSGWFSSGIKTYDCIVRIDGEVKDLKPGMTAVCEIHVDRLKDVLTLPVQAVVQRDRDNWCYVQTAGNISKRTLKLGRSNDKFVQIQGGVNKGDRVVLNPMAILEKAEGLHKGIAADLGAPEMPDSVAQTMKKQHEAAMADAKKSKNGEDRGGMRDKGGPPRGDADGATRAEGGSTRGEGSPPQGDGGRPRGEGGSPKKGGRVRGEEKSGSPAIQAGGG